MKRVVLQQREVSLWRRTFAYVIDLIVLSFIVYLPIGSDFAVDTEGSIFEEARDFSLGTILVGILAAFFSVFYWAVLEKKIGQSVGKMAMGLQVVDYNGKPLNLRQCILRNITKASTLILLVDLMYGILKKDNRRFFEVLSNTKVVSANGSF